MSSSATVTSADRLTFTGFLAALLHAALILGISFTATDKNPASHTLEVTLANYKSEQAPEKADFLAQENQQGSGTLDEAKMITTDVDANFAANSIKQTSPLEQQASAPKVKPKQSALISTTSTSRFQAQITPKQEAAEPNDTPEGPRKSLLERSLEIASLEAKLDSQRQIYAKTPRIQRLTAASTMKANDAYYVDSWRRKIENMGRINYPREAEGCFNDCSLRLLVSINPDGTINNLRVLESSGKKVLDDAAIRIVRRSAPFAPFTEEMKQDVDLLEIIRTWKFKGNRYMTGVN
ncbi:MAG: energy transducer TonB [Oleispira antarctica]|uniref:Putative TonB family protein n=1 Tax=Oleispira antarctica RB-8 TaxID=698738 RepID=R4YMF0_OLEAN|nr:energy transducer TonB [Oleispira antarctica]MBQ0793422.1 energy transducer TonB [Oleispira antarctica]CCK74263.1 Putative TonB family protein [Oleispira antarctica RB-8]